MISIHYFASIRESLDLAVEELALPAQNNTVHDVIDLLISRHGEPWKQALENPAVKVALNQSVVKRSATVRDGDEIAFFPPVTGG